jgi:hypothetical protein
MPSLLSLSLLVAKLLPHNIGSLATTKIYIWRILLHLDISPEVVLLLPNHSGCRHPHLRRQGAFSTPQVIPPPCFQRTPRCIIQVPNKSSTMESHIYFTRRRHRSPRPLPNIPLVRFLSQPLHYPAALCHQNPKPLELASSHTLHSFHAHPLTPVRNL